MPDYEVLISADVSGMTAAMEEAASSTESAMSDIEAVFEASGSVINDWAAQTSQAAQQSGEAFEAWRAETMGAMEGAAGSIATSTEEIIAELTGVAEAARASAAAVEEAAVAEAAAMEEAATESAAAAEAQAAGFKEAGSQIMLFSRALLPLVGITMGASAFKSAAEGMMQFGDSIRVTEAELNVGADEARGFNLAMQSLGAQSGQVATAIRRLESDASNGGKQLSRLGVSTKEASGEAKSGIELFTEVADRINNLADSNQKAEAATTLLGRSGLQLLGVLGQVGPTIAEYTAQEQSNTAANAQAVEQSLALHKALTDLQEAWQVAIIGIAPAIQGALTYIASAIGEVTRALQAVVTAAQAAGNALAAFAKAASAAFKAAPPGTSFWGGYKPGDAVDKTPITQTGPGFQGMGEEGVDIGSAPAGGKWAPPAGRGGKKKGGGGGADPMAGMDDALVSSDNEMKKLNDEFAKMGSESSIVAKASTQSFDQLKQTATTAYSEMKTDYDKWAAAVKSGDVEAAKAFEKDWKDATKAFQQAFEQAKQKAQQDMQQIKSTADQISSEISSVLNSAISGKLNWQQEFEKILEKMLSSLIKYLTHMAVMWVSHESQVLATQVSGGAAGLAAQKANNAQAGMSDAATAAKGAYSSAAQIPYIGWIIAPFAAAAAFAGVEAFGSAAGGAVIPPGTNPRLQLHENELVLPANYHRGLKQMMEGGGHGGSGNTLNMHMNMSSLDPRGMSELFMNNHDMIAMVGARALRGGLNPYTG